MSLLRRHPWILLAGLFCLPVIAWTVFIVLARQHPAQRIPLNEPVEATRP